MTEPTNPHVDVHRWEGGQRQCRCQYLEDRIKEAKGKGINRTESWTSGEIPGVILQKEMTARTPKECRQVCKLGMFDFLHQGCWQKQRESKIEVTEARLIRPVTERTQEPHQQQRRQEGEVLDRDGRKRFRRAHVAAVWRRIRRKHSEEGRKERSRTFRRCQKGNGGAKKAICSCWSACVQAQHHNCGELVGQEIRRRGVVTAGAGRQVGRQDGWTCKKKCCSTVCSATALAAFEQDAASPTARRKPVVHWDDIQQKMESSLNEGR